MSDYRAHIGYDLQDESRDWLAEGLSSNVALTIGEDVPDDVRALVAGRPTAAINWRPAKRWSCC